MLCEEKSNCKNKYAHIHMDVRYSIVLIVYGVYRVREKLKIGTTYTDRKKNVYDVKCKRIRKILKAGRHREPYSRSEIRSRECRLGRTSPSMLKGKRPVSVTFASGETIETPTWKKAVQTILKHCNGQPDMHERLMQLRGKVFGRQRTILGKDPEGMDVPIQIDKDLYFEAKFDTEALLTMIEKKVLEPVGYDFSGIQRFFMLAPGKATGVLGISEGKK